MKLSYSASEASQFRTVFASRLNGRTLRDYWDIGFNVTKFDDEIVESGNQSVRESVRQTWGSEAVSLVERLLGIAGA